MRRERTGQDHPPAGPAGPLHALPLPGRPRRDPLDRQHAGSAARRPGPARVRPGSRRHLPRERLGREPLVRPRPVAEGRGLNGLDERQHRDLDQPEPVREGDLHPARRRDRALAARRGCLGRGRLQLGRRAARRRPAGAGRGILPPCRSRSTAASATSRRRRSPRPGRCRPHPRPALGAGSPPVRRPAPPRQPPPLRRPPGDRRRPRLVGRPQGPDAGPRCAPDGRPRRGPPGRVLRLRGRDPGAPVRRRRRHRLGLGHLGAGGGDAGPGRGHRERRAEVPGARREDQRPLHDRADQPPPGDRAPDRLRGRRGRAVAAHPQARRARRRRLGRGGPPAEREDGPHQRRGQGRARRSVPAPPARRPPSPEIDLSARARGADAPLPRADAGHPGHEAVPRRGLAVRGQVGRLPRRGGRPRRRRSSCSPATATTRRPTSRAC